MMQKVPMEETGQAFLMVQGDAAKMLRVYCRGNIIRNDGASPACTHDSNQHISGLDLVARQLLEPMRCDASLLAPTELVGDGIVDPQHWNAIINKLAM
jgi:hypothetical protein